MMKIISAAKPVRRDQGAMRNNRRAEQPSSKSASLLAYEQIKEKILQNQLDSKKPLDEKVFSKEFTTSRTPIREALIMLEREGLIARQDGKGFYLRQFSMKDIQDLYEFREITETGIAGIIISKLSAEKIEALSAILDQIQPLIQKGTAGEILDKNFEFHMQFIGLCENSAIIEAMKNCHEKILRVAWSCKEQATSYEDYQQHRKILSALKKGELEKLQMTIRQHIQMARNNAVNILKSSIEKLYFFP